MGGIAKPQPIIKLISLSPLTIKGENNNTNRLMEITDLDREQIAGQIAEGYTSGRLDCDEGKHITWSLEAEAWEDE